MNERNYNPLNEGYSGRSTKTDDYTGTNSKSLAPKSIPSIKSAIIKPATSQVNNLANKSSKN